MEETKHPDPVIETYKGYQIEAYVSEPGRPWRVRITRVDGANIITKVPKAEVSQLDPPNEFLDSEAAIKFAKKIIDAGGMN